MAELSQDKEQLYELSSDWKDRIVEDFKMIGKKSASLVDDLFDNKPNGELWIVPLPETAESIKTSAPIAFYERPSPKGDRPGVTFLNLRPNITKFNLPNLYFHEGIPGHHFQLALQQETPNRPHLMAQRVMGFNAFVEGWALYVEQLMWEQGYYDNPKYEAPPAAILGFITDGLLRSVRLVIDTGIHAMGWSREKAIQYLIKYTGKNEQMAIQEVERYFISPGQACSYKIGQIKILQLRQRVKEALGDKFDIKEFHNVVLENGSLPLELLEEYVMEYISNKKIK